jgi:hypothetical protein
MVCCENLDLDDGEPPNSRWNRWYTVSVNSQGFTPDPLSVLMSLTGELDCCSRYYESILR